jgi:hypothetical protein
MFPVRYKLNFIYNSEEIQCLKKLVKILTADVSLIASVLSGGKERNLMVYGS